MLYKKTEKVSPKVRPVGRMSRALNDLIKNACSLLMNTEINNNKVVLFILKTAN